MAATLQPMKPTRDPALNPQPGDLARADQQVRRVLEVHNGKLLVQGQVNRYSMNIVNWREWCRTAKPKFSENGAK